MYPDCVLRAPEVSAAPGYEAGKGPGRAVAVPTSDAFRSRRWFALARPAALGARVDGLQPQTPPRSARAAAGTAPSASAVQG